MPTCPNYRLRLFLSVDLVGSTAFKARFGETRESDAQPFPRWVSTIRHFYQQFPAFLESRYRKIHGSEDYDASEEDFPKVWKTVGDEILFCCRVANLEHLSLCIASFLRALEDYGSYLDTQGRHLDVKGSGWTAAFPAPNITVQIGKKGASALGPDGISDQLDEPFELAADKNPAEFEFLGKNIDAGFRIAKNARADRIALSLELAWLLAQASQEKSHAFELSYHGRESLKGVIADRPYPVVTLEAERSTKRKNVRIRENAVLMNIPQTALHLCDFLEAFMQDEGVEMPIFQRVDAKLPSSYLDFEKAWRADAHETELRERGEKEAEDAPEPTGDGEVPSEVGEALEVTVADMTSDHR